MEIPFIDFFAGPGGLCEGFSQHPGFRCVLSVEMDPWAIETLTTRAFVHQFGEEGPPQEYYEYAAGAISRNELFALYKEEARKAKEVVCHAELGTRPGNEKVNKKLKALGERIIGESILLGGPPCQAYSLVGRSRQLGEGTPLQDPKAEAERQKKLKQQRLDFANDDKHVLYRKYLHVLRRWKPMGFVMENVKGILSSKQYWRKDGKKLSVFERILHDLKKQGYTLTTLVPNQKAPNQKRFWPEHLTGKDFVVKASDFGVPQHRERVFVIGIRDDVSGNIDLEKLKLEVANSVVTTEQAIGDLPKIRSGLNKSDKFDPEKTSEWARAIRSGLKEREFPASKLPTIKSFVHESQGGNFVKESLGEVPEGASVFHDFVRDDNLPGVLHHKARGHMASDLARYWFAANFVEKRGLSPSMMDFIDAGLQPDHKGITEALKVLKRLEELERLETEEAEEERQAIEEKGTYKISFADRFRVQVADTPSTTITSHISRDGHYYIHYDPVQCRSLTVREAARLQSFPDNYIFEGPRTEQYKQVGNAVPPLLGRAIAEEIAAAFTATQH